MKNLRNFLLVSVAIAAAFIAGNNTRPVQIEVRAQSTSAKANWITNQRAAMNTVWTGCQSVISYDQEYVANGYSTMVNGDFTGANSGILAADMVTAEGNAANFCKAILGTAASFPVSIATGTSTTITKVIK